MPSSGSDQSTYWDRVAERLGACPCKVRYAGSNPAPVSLLKDDLRVVLLFDHNILMVREDAVKSRFRLGIDSLLNYHQQMVESKTETVRKTFTISKKALRYLDRLAELGIHGSEWSGVARNFVEQGIQQAIKDGFITLDDE